MKLMTNHFTAFYQLKQNDLIPNMKLKSEPQASKLYEDITIYKKNTGMAFEVVNVFPVNGIKHCNPLIPETGSC